MRAIIKRELRNALRNPILWVGLVVTLFGLWQILSPYLQIQYEETKTQRQETGRDSRPLTVRELEQMADADITEGYVRSTEQERMELTLAQLEKAMRDDAGIPEDEIRDQLGRIRRENMSIDEIDAFLGGFGAEYYYDLFEFHKGDAQEVNAYIDENLRQHSFSWYFARKYADFCGLFLGFFAAVFLSFLFIQDTRRDTYELLHTKPVRAVNYVCGKIAGGCLSMAAVWAVLTLVFCALCEFYGARQGFPVSASDFLLTASVYILPNILMITCIYVLTALVFKNPLPALPCIFLYIVYSNMGSRNAEGVYGYYGRPLAIMVRFPGKFFETSPPSMALWNQTFLIVASALLTVLAIVIWKRRRVY